MPNDPPMTKEYRMTNDERARLIRHLKFGLRHSLVIGGSLDIGHLLCGHLLCNPAITTSKNSRDRLASASTPSGLSGRDTSGAKIFSHDSDMVSPVNATGCSSL